MGANLMDTIGALVGWSHHDTGDQVLLRLESMRSANLADDDTDLTRLLMTKQQALILGHYLMRISGETIPAPRTSWLKQIMRGKRATTTMTELA